jgi:hypothetical protein
MLLKNIDAVRLQPNFNEAAALTRNRRQLLPAAALVVSSEVLGE